MRAEDRMEDVQRAIGSGTPAEAIACYARWWQLESYLREIVYTELRSAYGTTWSNEVGERASNRAAGDQVNRYMPSADAEDVLSYADANVLFGLIDRHWHLFEVVLLPKLRWQGQIDTLLAIRNRVAHCRRPHSDDLSRIELMLRDLEAGARVFYGSYADTAHALTSHRDPLVKDWVKQRHNAAARLVEHCARKYDTRFRLGYSLRPWTEAPEPKAPICGHEGAIWHARWLLGDREVDPERLWKQLRSRTRDLILHLLVEVTGITATFSALEPSDEVADAIADVFDTLIMTSHPYQSSGDLKAVDAEITRTRSKIGRLPPKVQYQSALSMFDPLNPEAFMLFGSS
jgi:Swt1-like HEPN